MRTTLLIVAMLLVGCATDDPAAPRGPSPEAPTIERAQISQASYPVAPNDALFVRVFREEELSGKYRVEQDGMLNFPLIGRIAVARFTPERIEKLLEQRLSRGFLVNPDVQVSVVEVQPIYVGGAVNRPGKYDYSFGLIVEQAVTLAGGRNRFAAERYYIQRAGAPPDQRFRATGDTPLYPGDILSVEERLF